MLSEEQDKIYDSIMDKQIWENVEMSTPKHYLIAGRIETKNILDSIIDEVTKEYDLTGSQAFDLGSLLKYRLRAGKKNIASIEDDISKALHFEEMLEESLGV